MLRTLNTVPPGGWIYVQEYTDNGVKKTQRFKDMGPVNIVVGMILSFRTANKLPRATHDAVLDDIEQYTCERIGFDPHWCRVKKNSTPSPKSMGLRESVVAGVLRAAKNTATGAQILNDWLGEGAKPVAQAIAESRARICQVCPKNQEGHFLARLTGRIARAILEQRRLKLERRLSVPNEDALYTCTVCDCHLPLKMWVPLETILDRTHEDTLKQFPAPCWILTEKPGIEKPKPETNPAQ